MSFKWSEVLEIQLKYLDQSLAWQEKELAHRRAYRERLQGELNQARRLEREELQDDTKTLRN